MELGDFHGNITTKTKEKKKILWKELAWSARSFFPPMMKEKLLFWRYRTYNFYKGSLLQGGTSLLRVRRCLKMLWLWFKIWANDPSDGPVPITWGAMQKHPDWPEPVYEKQHQDGDGESGRPKERYGVLQGTENDLGLELLLKAATHRLPRCSGAAKCTMEKKCEGTRVHSYLCCGRSRGDAHHLVEPICSQLKST